MKNRKYILDTNIWVALLNGERDITARLRDEELLNQVCLSVISRGELVFGAFKSRAWEINLKKLSNLIQRFPLVYINEDNIAFTFGLMKSNLQEQGITIGDNDLWIASTAIHYRLTLVTRDRDFDRIKGFQLNIEAW